MFLVNIREIAMPFVTNYFHSFSNLMLTEDSIYKMVRDELIVGGNCNDTKAERFHVFSSASKSVIVCISILLHLQLLDAISTNEVHILTTDEFLNIVKVYLTIMTAVNYFLELMKVQFGVHSNTSQRELLLQHFILTTQDNGNVQQTNGAHV